MKKSPREEFAPFRHVALQANQRDTSPKGEAAMCIPFFILHS